MTASELRYLIAVNKLSEQGTAKLTGIAKNLNVSKVSVYKAVDRLESAGYLIHIGKKICLTEKGKAVLDEYLLIIGFISGHLEYHCGTPKETAYNDALCAASVFSDTSRNGIADFIRNKKKDR